MPMLSGDGITRSVDAVLSLGAMLRYAALGFWKTWMPVGRWRERKKPQS